MKKTLISILLVLVLVIMALFMKNGIHAGPFQAYSFQEISDKNQELTTAINKANTANDNYTSALSKLKTDISNLTKAKKDYLDLVTISTESEIKQATQTKNYTIEYLWSRVGNHATSEGVNLKMEVGSSTLNDSSYKNLNFTATGEFLALVQFIYSLENDANLDITIDKFDMTANKCTFTVADVKIQQENTTETISSVSSSSDNTAQSETTSNTVTQ